MQFPSGGNTISSSEKFRRRWEKFRNISNSPQKIQFPLGEIPANFEFVRRREKGHAAKRKHEKIG